MLRNPSHSQQTPCRHVHLARSGVGDICYCPDCGVVHVALQYFTMRFELDAFKALQSMLSEAQTAIAQRVHTPPKTLDPYGAPGSEAPYKAVVH